MYDGTTTATVSGTLVGVQNGDSLGLTGAFASPSLGTWTVTFGLSGANASSYTLTQPSPSVTASILNSAVWTNTVSGLNWSTAGNWSNNVVATNVGNTADFSQVAITADTTVNLDTNYTIGNLVFGNTAPSPSANWFLTDNTLTLAGTNPTVTVGSLGTGEAATISSTIAGTQGLTKAGSGNLALGAYNTYTGNTVVNGGTLTLNAGE